MASTSEVGHAKNVAHFATLITYCQGYGANYNPSNIAIKLPALNTLSTNAQAALTNTITAVTANNNAINARVVAFLNIKKLATRMLSALTAAGATAQQKANAKTINRKIQGSRAKIVPPPPTNNTNTNTSAEKTTTTPTPTPNPIPIPIPPTPISVAQLSFDQLIQHMAAFIALLQSIPAYNPNEADLKIAALNTYLTSLNTTNAAAVVAHTALNNARIARNKTLYQPITGLVDIATETKSYVKSVFGATSPEYKEISGLGFKKIKV